MIVPVNNLRAAAVAPTDRAVAESRSCFNGCPEALKTGGELKRAAVSAVVVLCSLLGVFAGSASAASGVEHLHFRAGPYVITPGANLILLDSNKVPKPTQNGYMVRMVPNLRYAKAGGACCGAIPRVDVIHLHHGVWLSNGNAGRGEGNSAYRGFYPFMAAGEEKTIYSFRPATAIRSGPTTTGSSTT